MTSEYWIGPNRSVSNPGSGNFSVASYWSGGYVPNSGTDVALYAAGGYEVFVDQTESVNSLLNESILDVTHQLTIASSSTFYNQLVTYVDEASLIAPNGLKLDGGGVIDLIEGGIVSESSASSSGTIKNVNNVIEGSGTIGSGTFTNDAAGTVIANQGASPGNVAPITFSTGNTVHNDGLMEATNDSQNRGGYLQFYDRVVNTGTIAGFGTSTVEIGGYQSTAYVNTFLEGGSVGADNASLLQVDPAAALIGATTTVDATATMTIGGTLEGGSVTSTGADNVTITSRAFEPNPTLDGSSDGLLTLDTNIDVTDGTTVNAYGTISNEDTLTLGSSDDQTELLIPTSTSLTLEGGGELDLADGGNDVIDAASNGGVFDNVDNTMSGAGLLGNGHLVLQNGGDVIAGNSVSKADDLLQLKLYGTSSSNSGRMQAVDGSTLEFVSGGLTSSGTVEAGDFGTDNAGNTVEFDAAFALGNLAGGTLTGGTWLAGSKSTLSFADGSVSKLAATLYLVDPGSTFKSGTGSSLQTIEQTLTRIQTGGTLDVRDGRGYTTGNAFTLIGTIDLEAGGTFSSGLISGTSGSIIMGYAATVASSVTTSGTVSATSGTLTFSGSSDTFSGKFAGGGTVAFASGTDTLNKGVGISTVTTLLQGATVQLGASVTDSGGFAMTGGTLSLASSTLTASGTGTLTGGTVTGPGTLALTGASDTVSGLTFTSGATLSHTGTGTLTASGTLALGGTSGTTDTLTNGAGAILQLYTGTLTASAGVTGAISNAGTLQKVGGSGKFTLGGTFTNTGTVLARTGTLEITGAVGGTGTLAVKGGTLQLDAGPGSGQTLAFQGTGTLALKANGTVAAPISGFAAGDTIDLLTLAGASVKSFTEAGDGKSGTLVIGNGTQTDTLKLAGSSTAANFATAKDAGGNGTAVTFKAGQAKAQVAAAATPDAEAVPHNLLAAMGTGHAGVPFAASDTWLAHGASHLFEPAGLHGSLQAPGLHGFSLAAEPHAFF